MDWSDRKPRSLGSEKTSKPRYEQIKQLLRHEIESGVLRPGQMLPNQAELTEKYRVSTITIRRALEDMARSGILKRVAGVGTFVRAGRPPPRVVLMLLGFDEVERWLGRSKIFSDLLAGIGEVAWDSWNMLSVVRARGTEDACAFLAKQTELGQLDGVIIKSRDGQDLPDVVGSLQVPHVAVHTTGRGPINCVTGDEFGEAQLLTKHLIERGYKRIGFIGPPIADLFERRYGGYTSSLRTGGIALDPDLVVQADDYEFQHVSRWIDRLLAHSGQPDAIFCGMGTLVASRMIAELAKRGLQVPRDLGFVMHDPDESGALFQPPVTSAGASNFELGRAAARLLDDLLKTPQSAPSLVVLRPHVVIRASTPQRLVTPTMRVSGSQPADRSASPASSGIPLPKPGRDRSPKRAQERGADKPSAART